MGIHTMINDMYACFSMPTANDEEDDDDSVSKMSDHLICAGPHRGGFGEVGQHRRRNMGKGISFSLPSNISPPHITPTYILLFVLPTPHKL